MCRKKMRSLAVPVDSSKRGVADMDGLFQRRRKHRPKIAGGATDDLKNLRRSSLLLKRFREVGCALGEVSRALAQFIEQPRILYGDDGLSSEVLHQRDLLVCKGTSFLAVHREGTDEFIFLQHWDAHHRPY